MDLRVANGVSGAVMNRHGKIVHPVAADTLLNGFRLDGCACGYDVWIGAKILHADACDLHHAFVMPHLEPHVHAAWAEVLRGARTGVFFPGIGQSWGQVDDVLVRRTTPFHHSAQAVSAGRTCPEVQPDAAFRLDRLGNRLSKRDQIERIRGTHDGDAQDLVDACRRSRWCGHSLKHGVSGRRASELPGTGDSQLVGVGGNTCQVQNAQQYGPDGQRE